LREEAHDRVPELETPEIRRTVFVIPGGVAKNRTEDPQPRLLVLNDAAQSIIDSVRGEDGGAVRRASAESPGRPFSFTSPRPVDMLKQRVRNRLAVRPRRRHPGGKRPDLSGELGLSFGDQNLTDCPPSPLHLPPGLDQLRLSGFNAQTSFDQVTGNAVNPLAGMARHAALLGAVDAIKLRCLALAAHRPLSGVGLDSQLAKVLGEVAAPLPQGSFADVQPDALLALGSDNYMHVRVALIGVQRQGVAMLENASAPAREAIDGKVGVTHWEIPASPPFLSFRSVLDFSGRSICKS